jgi:hypothetical protein
MHTETKYRKVGYLPLFYITVTIKQCTVYKGTVNCNRPKDIYQNCITAYKNTNTRNVYESTIRLFFLSAAMFIERCIEKQKYVARWMLPDLSMYPEVLPIVHGSVIVSYGGNVL